MRVGIPLLQKMNAQHALQWHRLAATTSSGIMGLDQGHQARPGNDGIHLRQKAFPLGLLPPTGKILFFRKGHLRRASLPPTHR